MRKVFVVCTVLACISSVFAENQNIKTDKGDNQYVPESSYTITKSKTDPDFSIIGVPLSIHINGKKFLEVGAGADLEITPFERIGFHMHGIKTYYSGSFDMDSTDSKSDSYLLEGGININFFIQKKSHELPVFLGSRYTGYNTITKYYENCDLPSKTTYSARIGYLRNSSKYTIEDDIYMNFKTHKNITIDSFYAGIEWNLFYEAEIEVNDENIERDFGKKFKASGKYKLYADVIYPVYKTGNSSTKYPAGFRIGYCTWGTPWSMKLEGGINPSFGGYFEIEMGLCYF